MTISTEVRKAGPFIGNDSASVFPFAFKVFKAADLIVVRRQDNIGTETTLVLDSDYHVTLNSNQDTTPGGVVTLVAGALASGFTLVVSSELPYLQTTDLTNQGGFYPKVITNALDRLTIFCQQLAEITGRTLKLPITAPTNISAEIPLPNPSELIAWDETGTRLTTVSPQSLVTSIAYGSATADLFAGDGISTTFPLSTNPASVNNLDVSIGGHSQRPVQGGVGDYSWNGGASITFVVPPPAPTVPGDKNVLVRYMQAIPVSDSEALHAQTREALRRGYAEAGYNLVDGSFETGGTLASATDVLLLESTGVAYSWEGVYSPGGYDVAPGTDPVAVAGYAPRSDVVLRNDMNVVVKVFESVADMVADASLVVGQKCRTLGYYAAGDGGGNHYEIVAAATGTDDGGSYIDLSGSGLQAKGLFVDSNVASKRFGSHLDDTNDDTVALQNFINYLCSNHIRGTIEAGTAKITAKLNFKNTYGWGLLGNSPTTTIMKQYTNNTPIFDLGSIAGDAMHSYILQDIGFDYSVSQPRTNTSANPILFSSMGFEGAFHRLRFAKGSWAIKVASGVGGPWGQTWDDLVFASGLTGGASDWTGAVNAVPNNHWGRFFVDATSMYGPIFNNIRGYNFVVDTVEVIFGTNVQLFNFSTGASAEIGAIKLEVADYSGALTLLGNALIYAPGSYLNIGQVHIGGTTCSFLTANPLYLFAVSTGVLNVKKLVTELTVAPSNFYVFNGGGKYSEIVYSKKGAYTVPYSNIASTTAGDYLTVIPDFNLKLSGNMGDSDYTVIGGDPAIIKFSTPLTAPRTLNIQSDGTCFNGLTYRVISKGAVNGANTITIKSAGNTKYTITVDNAYVDLCWSRDGTPHKGWFVIGYGDV